MTNKQGSSGFNIFDLLLAFAALLVVVVLLLESSYSTSKKCTPFFCEKDKVKMLHSGKVGVISEWKGNVNNPVWEVYIEEDKMYYTVPENILTKEE